jgi:hypothetical protein
MTIHTYPTLYIDTSREQRRTLAFRFSDNKTKMRRGMHIRHVIRKQRRCAETSKDNYSNRD